jgi:hypothetical protein
MHTVLTGANFPLEVAGLDLEIATHNSRENRANDRGVLGIG